MFERKATAAQLDETNKTIAAAATALATLVGVLGATIARETGADPERVRAEFLRLAGPGETPADAMFAQAIAKALQLAAMQSELAELQAAREGAGG